MFEDNKVEIKIPTPENVGFKFNSKNIIVKPYFTLVERIAIVEEYLSNLGDQKYISPQSYFMAEYSLILQVIDFCTNIDIEKLDASAVVNSGLWNEIKTKIIEYDDFRKELDKVVEIVRNKESVGEMVRNLYEKSILVLENISEMNVDNFKDLVNQLDNKLNELNETFPGITGKPVGKRRSRGRSKKTE